MSRYRLVENDEVEMMIESSKKGMHRTLEGQMVKIGSPECRDDILKRMDDMSYHRNDQNHGSDARAYFSGVLKVLRRKLRENDKVSAEDATLESEVLEELHESRKIDEQSADRMLKLAGLID